MKVLIPSPLHAYTHGQRWVDAQGDSLAAVLDDLDRQFPGIRFRMVDEQGRARPHMRIFVNGAAVFDLSMALRDTDEIGIVQALSGG